MSCSDDSTDTREAAGEFAEAKKNWLAVRAHAKRL
jgi:hypothetical protein